MLKFKFFLINILFYLFPVSLYSQDVIVIGNSNYNNIEYISSSLSGINIDHTVWNNYEETALIDSLLLIENTIIIWQSSNVLSNDILYAIENKINDNNTFLLFSKNIENNDSINNLFSFTKIRNNYAQSIAEVETDNIWQLDQATSISELGWLGSAYPQLMYTDLSAFAGIAKSFSNGKTLIAGFDLDNIVELSNFLDDLMLYYLSFYNKIIIGNIEGIPGDTLYIPINLNIAEDMVAINFTIQSEPDFLYFFDMIPSSNMDFIAWDINPLPFGIIDINGALTNGFLESGEYNIGFLKALIYPSSTNKVSLRGIDNLITYYSGHSVGALFQNGEIDILYDYSVVELVPPVLIEPDSMAIMNIDLFTDHNISAIQLCLEYESTLIGINGITPTSNIPDNWFVSFVNHPGNNRTEIFCFGFEPMDQISGPIIEVELESYSQAPSILPINFCDILLAGEDSDNINSIGIDTEIVIDYPDLSIIPTSVISDNKIDVLYNTSNYQQISGFQYDIAFDSNLNLFNVILGNISSDYMGNWTLLDDRTIRFIYFNEFYNIDQSEKGFLLSSGFTIIDSDAEDLHFSVSNVVLTDNNYELLSVKFEDFYFENILSLNGDSNGDNSIDIFDIVIIVNYILDNINIGEAQKNISDVNDDSYVTVEDVIVILNNILYE